MWDEYISPIFKELMDPGNCKRMCSQDVTDTCFFVGFHHQFDDPYSHLRIGQGVTPKTKCLFHGL